MHVRHLSWLALVSSVAHADVDSSGRFTQEVAIAVPAFHSITPEVRLRYSSGSANGFVGVGWQLDAGSKITRMSATRGIARNDASDRYVLDGVELVSCVPPPGGAVSPSPSCATARALGSDADFYSTKIETYQRIRRDTSGWTVWSRDGTQRTYATSDAGRTFDLSTTRDTHGNTVRYTRSCGSGNCYPGTIKYADANGPGAEITFVREARTDKLSLMAGKVFMDERLRAIVVKMDGKLVRAYELGYDQSQSNGASILSSVEQFGRDAVVGANGRYVAGATQALPVIRFTTPSLQGAGYTETRLVTDSGLAAINQPNAAYANRLEGAQVTYHVGGYQNDGDGEWVERPHGQAVGDFDGDGRGDWLAWSISNNACTQFETKTILMTKTGSRPVVTSTIVAGPGPQTQLPTAQRCQPTIFSADLNGDRRDDLLMLAKGELTQIIANGNGTFTKRSKIAWTSAADRCAITDLDGDGREDLACTGDESGAIKLTIARSLPDGSWQVTTDALTGLGVVKDAHDITGGDFNGDGLGDLTIATRIGSTVTLLAGASDGSGYVTWASQATPWVASSPRIRAGDIDGDGKSDIVIGSNVGFAAKGATARYRLGTIMGATGGTLADHDGDGRADLFLGLAQGWAHGRGDGWFDPPVPGAPIAGCDGVNADISVSPVDLNGDGRTDVLCTSDEFPTYTIFDRMTPAIAEHPHWLQADISGDGNVELVHISHLAPGYLITTVSTLTQTKSNFTLLPTNNVPQLDEPDTERFIVMDVGSASGAPDGKADLVLVDAWANGQLRVYTLLSNGDGTFTARMKTLTGTYALDLQNWRAADLDGDGRGDLVHVVGTATGVLVESLRAMPDGSWIERSDWYFAGVPLVAGHDFMAIDVSGDGLTDLVHSDGHATANTSILRTLLGNGDGTFAERTWPYATSFRDLKRVKIADLDGDGLADLVHLARGGPPNASYITMLMYLSDGNGGWRFQIEAVGWSSAQAEDANLLEDVNLSRFIDVDGDGRTDLVHLSSYIDAAGWPATAILVGHNPGAGALADWPASLTKNLQFWAFTAQYDQASWRWQSWRDPLDGDAALIYIHPTQSRAYYFRARRDQITKIDNGIGGITKVTYGPLLGARTYLPEGSLPRVVRAVELRDEIASPAISEVVQYGYGEARYSIPLGTFGFGWRTVRDHDSIELTHDSVDDFCGARPTQVKRMTHAGVFYSYSNIGYVEPTANGRAPYTCDQNVDELYTCEGGPSCRLARSRVVTPDMYGNAVSTLETADQAATLVTLRPLPANAYPIPGGVASPSMTNYIVDKPQSEMRYGSIVGGWSLLSVSRFGYDNRTFDLGPGTRGLLTTVERHDDTANLLRTTTLLYSASGMLERTTDPAGQVARVTYDATYGLFPTSTCSARCATIVVDPVSGQTTDVTDENGAHTKTSYDAHGRLASTKRPTGGITTTTYLGTGTAAQRIRTEVADGTADGLWSEAYFDGLGRTVRTTREGGASEDTLFSDASSLPRARSNVYATGTSPPAWTTFEYDPAGRLIRTTAPDATQRQTAFQIGKTIGTDERGHPKTAYNDGRGRVIQIDEQSGASTITTRYVHDALGRLRTVTDHAGLVTTINYDSLGRQRTTIDPDRGTRTFGYLANGLLETTTDATGQVIRYAYDASGRRIRREDTDTSGAITRTATWTWDRDPDHGTEGASIGRVVRMTDDQAGTELSESYEYNLDGQLTERTRCIDGTCMGTRSTYDGAGRLSTVVYPDSHGYFGAGEEAVPYGYDTAGRLRSVGNYVTALTYELDDRDASITFGNGVTTTTTYGTARRWIESVTAISPVQGEIYRADYTHDAVGRIRSLDERNAVSTSFAYSFDDLGRLIDVTASDVARSEKFSFDAIGRMRWSSATGDLRYDAALHPHAPTSSDFGALRTYDALGNLTSLRDPDGRAFDLAWTVDNTLASMTNRATRAVTRFAYDPSGDRVKKKSSRESTTLYFGPHLELANGRYIKYYRAGDRLIARRDDGQLTYYTQDLTRSTRAITDTAGRVANRYDYSAFGRVVAASEYIAQDHEHGDGRHDDETNLTYMNARYYDPALMHFISADSVVPSIHDPQSFHRYSYAQQDPIDFWDPSGHMRASVERKKELEAQSNLQWMYTRAGYFCGTGICWQLPIERMAEIQTDARWALWSAANHNRVLAKQAAMRREEAVKAAHVDVAEVNAKAAADQVDDGVRSSETLSDWLKRVGEELAALDHDLFAFAGREVDASFPFGKLKFGQTLELMTLAGHSSEAGFYLEGLSAAGYSAEAKVAGTGAYVGLYGALVAPIWTSKPTSSQPLTGILFEGSVGPAYAGAYDFGAGHRGFYVGARYGHWFVGGGMSYQTLTSQVRAVNMIYERIVERFGGGK